MNKKCPINPNHKTKEVNVSFNHKNFVQYCVECKEEISFLEENYPSLYLKNSNQLNNNNYLNSLYSSSVSDDCYDDAESSTFDKNESYTID